MLKSFQVCLNTVALALPTSPKNILLGDEMPMVKQPEDLTSLS